MAENWIDLWEAGNYPQGNFTEKDLDEIVESYDPRLHEAPHVIGHPKVDDPAYGWIDRVRRVGKRLQGLSRQILPEFREWVRQGLYKKRSVTLSRSIDPKGRLYLKNVGWLGAAPPAVKGLANVQFAATANDTVIEFDAKNKSDQEEETEMADEKNKQTDPAAAAGGGISGGQPAAGADAAKAAEFAEKLKAMETENAKLRKELEGKAASPELAEFAEKAKVMEGQVAALQRSLRVKDTETRLKELGAEGKVTPAMMKLGLVEFMADLDNSVEVQFAEGVKESREAFMWRLLGNLPKVVQFGERGLAARAAGINTVDVPAEFAEADPKQLELNAKAKKYQKEHNCSYAEALAQIRA